MFKQCSQLTDAEQYPIAAAQRKMHGREVFGELRHKMISLEAAETAEG
jgi:hypothetical protein